jgi:hypothetical protein
MNVGTTGPRGSLAAVAAIAIAATAVGSGLAAKPPRPKLELLTESQEAVLRNHAVKLEVRSRRGDEARVKATLVVDGFPDDYTFRLGPESRPLRGREAKLRLPLSRRQEEVLAFAQQACDKATLTARAKAGRRVDGLTATLRSRDC